MTCQLKATIVSFWFLNWDKKMKRMVLVSLFSLNLMTAFAYAQSPQQTVMPTQETNKTTKPVTSPASSSLANSEAYQSVSQTQAQAVKGDALIPLQVSTVSAAKSLKDNTEVRLQGQVIRALGKDKYEFRDATGTMIVEIDDQKWHGKPVTQLASVTLIGEIDRESDNNVELDVEEVRSVPAKP